MGYEYLDSYARKLKEAHPRRSDFIDSLLASSKSRLSDGTLQDYQEDVKELFEEDVLANSGSRKVKRSGIRKSGFYKRAP